MVAATRFRRVVSRIALLAGLLLVGITSLIPQIVLAQNSASPSSDATSRGAPKDRGLFITPIRQYINLPAGTTKKSNFTVGNYTDKPMTISFSIKQFSVADYTYDFEFDEAVGTKLVTLGETEAQLNPNQSRTIPYEITVPLGSTPGGRYYTILATAAIGKPGASSLNERVQAASLVYITIEGKLSHANNIGATTMPKLVFGKSIPFTIDVSNTGNTHYFMYLNAQLHGPLTKRSQTTESHLLLPIKTRHIESSIPSPVLPGIYRATYGYRTEFDSEVGVSKHVVFIPPWSIASLVILGYVAWFTRSRIKRRQNRTEKPTDS